MKFHLATLCAVFVFCLFATTALAEETCPAPEPGSETPGEEVPEVEATAPDPAPICLGGGISATMYGFIRLDLAYNTHHMVPDNLAIYVRQETGDIENDAELDISMRLTRLGFNFSGPCDSDVLATGKLEVDFFGDGAENKNEIRMRHAYLEIECPDKGMKILAGQTWDLVSSLLPVTANGGVGWGVGNIGYRRPQIRITKQFGDDLVGAIAIARAIGSAPSFGTASDTGQDSGVPHIQGAFHYTGTLLCDLPSKIGVSFAWGQEEDDIAADDENTYDMNVVCFELKLPVNDKWEVQAEVWSGQGLGAYYGGILQSFNAATETEIAAMGYWVRVAYKLNEKSSLAFATMTDDPEDDDLAVGSRCSNTSHCITYFHNFSKQVRTSVEIGMWETEYKDQDAGDAIRVMGVISYHF